MTLLKTGSKAPALRGMDQDGRSFGLKDFAGRKLVLYFYPKDDTPGCTAEACSLRDEHVALRRKGYEVVGVSADEVKKHKKFATKYDLPFRLLADTELTTIKAYGVWGRKKFMGREFDGIIRTTFLINEKGVIERIITAVRTADHARQILVDDKAPEPKAIARGSATGKSAVKVATRSQTKGAAKVAGKPNAATAAPTKSKVTAKAGVGQAKAKSKAKPKTKSKPNARKARR